MYKTFIFCHHNMWTGLSLLELNKGSQWWWFKGNDDYWGWRQTSDQWEPWPLPCLVLHNKKTIRCTTSYIWEPKWQSKGPQSGQRKILSYHKHVLYNQTRYECPIDNDWHLSKLLWCINIKHNLEQRVFIYFIFSQQVDLHCVSFFNLDILLWCW